MIVGATKGPVAWYSANIWLKEKKTKDICCYLLFMLMFILFIVFFFFFIKKEHFNKCYLLSCQCKVVDSRFINGTREVHVGVGYCLVAQYYQSTGSINQWPWYSSWFIKITIKIHCDCTTIKYTFFCFFFKNSILRNFGNLEKLSCCFRLTVRVKKKKKERKLLRGLYIYLQYDARLHL